MPDALVRGNPVRRRIESGRLTAIHIGTSKLRARWRVRLSGLLEFERQASTGSDQRR